MVVSWSSLKVFGTKASEEILLLRKESFAARLGGFQLLDLIITELKSHMT